MATRTSQFHLPNPTTGAQEIHHFETEVGQVVGLKEQYRQPSTTYAVGNIAYHSALPTGWYLECTTAGTSGSGELTISSPAIGGTVTDGTVIWTVSKDLSALGGAVLVGNALKKTTDDSYLIVSGGNTKGASLLLNGESRSGYAGIAELYATVDDKTSILRMGPNGDLLHQPISTQVSNDLGGSAIVAKSLGTNGYIKYASGLIMQWGRCPTEEIDTTVTFPISFTAIMSISAQPYNNSKGCYIYSLSLSSFRISSPEPSAKMWLAIGY